MLDLDSGSEAGMTGEGGSAWFAGAQALSYKSCPAESAFSYVELSTGGGFGVILDF